MDYLRKLYRLPVYTKIFLMILLIVVVATPFMFIKRRSNQPQPKTTNTTARANVTPATKLGLSNVDRFTATSTELKNDYWTVTGGWTQDNSHLISIGTDSLLLFNISGKRIHITAGTVQTGSLASIEITVDGSPRHEVVVGSERTYTLVEGTSSFVNAQLVLKVPSGVKLSEITFD